MGFSKGLVFACHKLDHGKHGENNGEKETAHSQVMDLLGSPHSFNGSVTYHKWSRGPLAMKSKGIGRLTSVLYPLMNIHRIPRCHG